MTVVIYPACSAVAAPQGSVMCLRDVGHADWWDCRPPEAEQRGAGRNLPHGHPGFGLAGWRTSNEISREVKVTKLIYDGIRAWRGPQSHPVRTAGRYLLIT